jgi:hypothetical protein
MKTGGSYLEPEVEVEKRLVRSLNWTTQENFSMTHIICNHCIKRNYEQNSLWRTLTYWIMKTVGSYLEPEVEVEKRLVRSLNFLELDTQENFSMTHIICNHYIKRNYEQNSL